MNRVVGPLWGRVPPSLSSEETPSPGSSSSNLSVTTAGYAGAHPLGPARLSESSDAAPTRRVDLDSPEGKRLVEAAKTTAKEQGIDPSQLVLRHITIDELDMTHVRFDRSFEGNPVYGEQLIVHSGKNGSDLTNRFEPIAEIKLNETTIGKQQAIDTAIAILEKYGTVKTCEAEPVLYFSDIHGHHIRAYEVCAHLDTQSHHPHAEIRIMIHGSTGEAIGGSAHTFGIWRPRPFSIPQGAVSEPGDGPLDNEPVGEANDKTQYSGFIEIRAEQQNDRYRLFDGSRGKGILTKDARGGSSSSRARELFDDNNTWGEETDPPNTFNAIDAHFAAQVTYDTIKKYAGMNSIDGRGYQLRSNVNVRSNFVNAYWDGREMFYGSGDGRRAGPLTTLDIGGHEIHHGLTTNTWDGIYSGESGGLNESFSDIGGFMTEYHAANTHDHLRWDWRMGEDAWTPGNGIHDALRYMNNPTQDDYSVDHYSNYPKQREVHGSSGISNAAFYQLADRSGADKTPNSVSGVRIEGIGIEKAARIFYRGFIKYLTRRATFSDARRATIRAAQELHGEDSREAMQVAAAWSAVGVEDDNTRAPMSGADPLKFLDVLLEDHDAARV